jgi:putative heme utilization carrier protein HutX
MNDSISPAIRAVRAELAAKPDGVLEALSERHGVSYVSVLQSLEPLARQQASAAAFEEIWLDLTTWGSVTFVVHTLDGVFEAKAPIPPGSMGRGYFNIHGDSPIGGHLRIERCADIYFVDRIFFGRRSCSIQFINVDGEAMFKIFVGRDERREMKPEQLARFEHLRETFARPAV